MTMENFFDCKKIAFLSANGAVGKTTFCFATAFLSTLYGRKTTLVDLEFYKYGLDVFLGLEGEKGLRWSDLLNVNGDISQQNFSENLISKNSLKILSTNYKKPEENAKSSIQAVLEEMKENNEFIFFDTDIYSLQKIKNVDICVIILPPTINGICGAKALYKKIRRDFCKSILFVISNLNYRNEENYISELKIKDVLDSDIATYINPEKYVNKCISNSMFLDLRKAKKIRFSALQLLKNIERVK